MQILVEHGVFSARHHNPLGIPMKRGMTLIELLAVIVIITVIVAAAIPLLSPSNNDRSIREASRALNTYITGAQARAISTRRPWGIAIKRLAADTNRPEDRAMSLEVFYLEEPVPFCGLDQHSSASVALHPNLPGMVLVRFLTRGDGANMPKGWMADAFAGGVIRPKDVIEIGGTRYELQSDNQLANIRLDDNGFYTINNTNAPACIVAKPLNDSGQQIMPLYNNIGERFDPIVVNGTAVQARGRYCPKTVLLEEFFRVAFQPVTPQAFSRQFRCDPRFVA